MTEKKKSNEAEKKPICFVIMPISDVDGYPKGHFKEVYDQLIRPAAVECGYNVIRADEVAQSNMIHLDVVSKVLNADLCICDLSTKNANVFFELGIRQAFDKPTVLIKDDSTSRAFDLQDFRDVTYPKSLRISETLTKRQEIEAAIDATMEAFSNSETNMFSLVSMLNLAEAASKPGGEGDPIDAKFELLMRQIDTIQSQIAGMNQNSRQLLSSSVDTLQERIVSVSSKDGKTHLWVDDDGDIFFVSRDKNDKHDAKLFSTASELTDFLIETGEISNFLKSDLMRISNASFKIR